MLMSRASVRHVHSLLTAGLLLASVSLIPPPAAAQSCEDTCYNDYNDCRANCDTDCSYFGICDPYCYDNCNSQLDSCTTSCASSSVRTGMTWTVLGQQNGYVHVGTDGQTNAYSGDTAIDQYLPVL